MDFYAEEEQNTLSRYVRWEEMRPFVLDVFAGDGKRNAQPDAVREKIHLGSRSDCKPFRVPAPPLSAAP